MTPALVLALPVSLALAAVLWRLQRARRERRRHGRRPTSNAWFV